jgi:signal transduction histidine kinase
VRTGSPVIVNDVRHDPRFSERADAKTGFHTHSVLCCPLTIEDECLGAIELVNKCGKDGFGEHDLVLAEAVASQIAMAIHNVQLTEKALKAARLAAIGEAVASIAHCMRNVLNGLQGGCYLIKRAIGKADSDPPDKGLQMLERELHLLRDLVDNMLTYAKDRKPDYETTDVNEVVGSVIDLMKGRAGERGLTLHFEPDSDLGSVEVDPNGVYRCVLNLITNGLEACEKEGAAVTVSTCSSDPEWVSIQVADQGCGMDEETRKSIFRPFFSLKGGKGTGLGLSVTQKIITEHGGSIEVDSTEGEGSAFRILLPRKRPPTA